MKKNELRHEPIEPAQNDAPNIEPSEKRLMCNTDCLTAYSTAAMAVFTLFLVITSCLQWSAVKSTLKEMQSEQRPWINLADIERIPLKEAQTNRFVFRLKFQNIGKTAPDAVWIGAEVVDGYLEVDGRPVRETVAQKYAEMGDRALANNAGKVTIMPGDTFRIDNDDNYIKAAFSSDEARRMKEPLLVGCVTYSFFGDKTPHRSIFMANFDSAMTDPVKRVIWHFGAT